MKGIAAPLQRITSYTQQHLDCIESLRRRSSLSCHQVSDPKAGVIPALSLLVKKMYYQSVVVVVVQVKMGRRALQISRSTISH